ncbi:putative methyltransferase PMT [Parasponia andersonii]|uniref:Methyltransferase n=1 Tax=Parasponia andersonii TaxID=3476 RepID=A0A2P5AWE7_PARAD|nr:putative methyltransferase PMT [Parasponia andersonii]
MAIARLSRQAKRPYGFCAKMTAVAILGLCFVFVWSLFSSSSSSVAARRESFDEMAEPVSGNSRVSNFSTKSSNKEVRNHDKKVKSESSSEKDEKKANGSVSKSVNEHKSEKKSPKVVPNKRKGKEKKKLPEKGTEGDDKAAESEEKEEYDSEKEIEDGDKEGLVVDGKEEALDRDGEASEDAEGEGGLVEIVDQENEGTLESEDGESRKGGQKRKKIKGPLFDPKMHHSWKLCSTRSKHNYIPCIDYETSSWRAQSYRHTERICPRTPIMCLVPLPHDRYEVPLRWPESKEKIFYKNVAHPKLAAFIKKHSWVMESGDYLAFPQNQSEFKGGVLHYLESIEEMVPDIEWGKNIRVVLDMGCADSSFGASLFNKEVLTLSVGLKDDLVDLAQVSLERGFPTIVSPFGNRRLPFPSGVFDTIHCGGCTINWHSNGGKHLLEINRILRPGGYFILSTKHDNIEDEEAMNTLTSSICWNILAHKTDDVSEVSVKIYQKPESNEIYQSRRRRYPPLCKEDENPDAAWYVAMKTCLHTIPSSIEQRGTEWPEEWPKRLETLPDWLDDKDKLAADTKHWTAIVEKSYLTGMGIAWSNIRNVMDMKAIYGGFAAALAKQNVWVMNVVPVHAPDTLPIIFDRGLVGTYHDWCESFSTYPRSYDLLHADHLFSRLKNRCKQPVSIVVEMDRILRPGGWAIIRDKVEILDPLEGILKSLQWDIRMTFAKDKEGIICAQKTKWRP